MRVFTRIFSSLVLLHGTSVLAAPPCADLNFSWNIATSSCRPNINYLSTDFGYSTNGEFAQCGPGRVALSGDGNYLWTEFSSSGAPASSNTNVYAADSYNYPFTTNSAPNSPNYGFPAKARCYCMSAGPSPRSYNPTSSALPTNKSATVGTGSSTDARVYPVTFDVINSQTQAASLKYGPIAIAKDSNQDGRDYNVFSAGAAVCGCPNFNETAHFNGNGSNLDPIGMHCVPAFLDTIPSSRVLAHYDPAFHDVHVINPSVEPRDLTDTKYVDTVKIPEAGGNQEHLVDYKRKIWTCASPFLRNGQGECVYHRNQHRCDNGTSGDGAGGGSFASAVSEENEDSTPSSSVSAAALFDRTVNKKLACCMNSFRLTKTSGQNYEKFDCIDNSAGPFNNFDQLWASSDPDEDGGRNYAVLLRSAKGNLVTGFYSLKGQRCDQFSEFAYEALDSPGCTTTSTTQPSSGIKKYKLDPKLVSGQQSQVGSVPVLTGIICLPGGDYRVTSGKVRDVWRKRVPTRADDYLACPILVRAAMVSSCPTAVTLPSALTTVRMPAPGGSEAPRCASASGTQIHIRIEQIYEITGQPNAKTIDTVIEANQSASIDIGKIILTKYGDQCPPGTGLHGGTICTY